VSFVYDFDYPHNLPLAEVKAIVGGKAANLAVMATELGLPVPPGFVAGTAACKAYLAGGWPEGLEAELREHMARVEKAVGRRFGDPSNPLLVSVRSGAPISMPGMMDTILDLGLNDATEKGLAAASGDPAFAADCHSRFLNMFKHTVGVDTVPDDPWQQLRAAVEAVFRSWNSDRACAYRHKEGIADDLGTAVTVQAMVFGNLSSDSATGVLFTRNPATGEAGIYGDIMFSAQGEDVVAGTHKTDALTALDERLPAVAAELRSYAATLEHHYADLCDIEFTIERGKLWMLQVRVGKRSPQAALRMAVEMAEDGDFPLSRTEAVQRTLQHLAAPPVRAVPRGDDVVALTSGLPASPGVAAGEIVTTPDAAETVAGMGRPVILVRAVTSPDDVRGMAKAAGILTSLGGLNSHAAVVARGWNIPAVVGAGEVEVLSDGAVIAGRRFAAGETITIDGGTGEVFAGDVCGACEVVPEAATLLRWAQELGIEIAAAPAAPAPAAPTAGGTAAPAALAAPTGPGTADAPAAPAAGTRAAITKDDVLRSLLVKGQCPPESIAQMLLADADGLQPAIDEAAAAGLAELASGTVRLTAEGKLAAHDVFGAERERLGAAKAEAALDAFLPFDHRMKDIVTAWQVRETGGEPALNDHADAAYDAGVLAGLAALHDEAGAWLGALTTELGRIDAYRVRLGRALDLARDGDQRFVASPRVESYHTVWFELHEDLIRLSGRKRAEEVAAGRA
jgi:pyruvate,orthophosphate dikinase